MLISILVNGYEVDANKWVSSWEIVILGKNCRRLVVLVGSDFD